MSQHKVFLPGGSDNASSALLVAVVVSLLVVPMTCCLDNYQDGFYLCSGAHLTDIPDDIPEDAQEVYLHNNNLGHLEADAFSGLSASQWEVLSFSINGIGRF